LIRQLHTTLRTRLTLLYVFLLCIVPLSYVAWTSVFLWRTLLGELDLSLDRDIETGLRHTYHTLQNLGDTWYHRDVIGSMLEEVYRLTHLVDSLLILARADAGHLPLQRRTVPLLDLGTESAGLLELEKIS
jgi:signal transduction histidine kinase